MQNISIKIPRLIRIFSKISFEFPHQLSSMREFQNYPPLIKLLIMTHRKERRELRLHKHMEIL